MRYVLVVVLLSLCSGCGASWYQLRYGDDKPHISYAQLETKENINDRIFVWNPNRNAAYINKNDQDLFSACFASADVVRYSETEEEIAIVLGKMFEKIDSSNLKITSKELEKITKIGIKNESATFLNVALFHVCMMANNRSLNSDDVTDIIKHAIDRSAELNAAIEE